MYIMVVECTKDSAQPTILFLSVLLFKSRSLFFLLNTDNEMCEGEGDVTNLLNTTLCCLCYESKKDIHTFL